MNESIVIKQSILIAIILFTIRECLLVDSIWNVEVKKYVDVGYWIYSKFIAVGSWLFCSKRLDTQLTYLVTFYQVVYKETFYAWDSCTLEQLKEPSSRQREVED